MFRRGEYCSNISTRVLTHPTKQIGRNYGIKLHDTITYQGPLSFFFPQSKTYGNWKKITSYVYLLSTGEKKKMIDGINCSAWEMKSWIPYGLSIRRGSFPKFLSSEGKCFSPQCQFFANISFDREFVTKLSYSSYYRIIFTFCVDFMVSLQLSRNYSPWALRNFGNCSPYLSIFYYFFHVINYLER